MLLNLSNHPSTTWPENQMQLANTLYGEVVDMPFPQIDPCLDEAGLSELVLQYFDRLKEKKPLAVHLMGELTFCFALVQLLKSQGISCLASTTHRTTQDLPDGTKVSRFEFVRFRQY